MHMKQLVGHMDFKLFIQSLMRTPLMLLSEIQVETQCVEMQTKINNYKL